MGVGATPAPRGARAELTSALRYLPAQDLELVTKDEDLDLCDMVGAMVRCDKGEEPTKHQVEERSRHGGDTVTPGDAQPWTTSAGCLIEFLYPTGRSRWDHLSRLEPVERFNGGVCVGPEQL